MLAGIGIVFAFFFVLGLVGELVKSPPPPPELEQPTPSAPVDTTLQPRRILPMELESDIRYDAELLATFGDDWLK
jgi:hypothetical protein